MDANSLNRRAISGNDLDPVETCKRDKIAILGNVLWLKIAATNY